MLWKISIFSVAIIIFTKSLCVSRFPRLKIPHPRTCSSMMGRIPSGKEKVLSSNIGLNFRQKVYTNQSAVFQKPGTQSNYLLEELWLLSMCVVLAHGKWKVMQFNQALSLLKSITSHHPQRMSMHTESYHSSADAQPTVTAVHHNFIGISTEESQWASNK